MLQSVIDEINHLISSDSPLNLHYKEKLNLYKQSTSEVDLDFFAINE
jgi:hypothetical protein